MTPRYTDAFDHAVSEAKASGCVPEITEQARENILAGLELYAQEMSANGDMEQWVIECDLLAEQLQVEWQTEAAAEQSSAPRIDMKMEGM